MARKPFTQTCYECMKVIKFGQEIVIKEDGYFVVYCAQDVPMKAVA